jgi:hypothetical protein
MHGKSRDGNARAAGAARGAIVACEAQTTAPASVQDKKMPRMGHFFIAGGKPLILQRYWDMHSAYPKACPQSLWVTCVR